MKNQISDGNHHRREVCLGLDPFGLDDEGEEVPYHALPALGTVLHGRPQQGLDGEGDIKPEYSDMEIELIPPGEDFVMFSTGTASHTLPKQEYGDGEIYA